MLLLFQRQQLLCVCESVCVCLHENEKQLNKNWHNVTGICVMMNHRSN